MDIKEKIRILFHLADSRIAAGAPPRQELASLHDALVKVVEESHDE